MLLLDVHRRFRKTGRKINITKFQKVEFLVCDLVMYIHPYYFFNFLL